MQGFGLVAKSNQIECFYPGSFFIHVNTFMSFFNLFFFYRIVPPNVVFLLLYFKILPATVSVHIRFPPSLILYIGFSFFSSPFCSFISLLLCNLLLYFLFYNVVQVPNIVLFDIHPTNWCSLLQPNIVLFCIKKKGFNRICMCLHDKEPAGH